MHYLAPRGVACGNRCSSRGRWCVAGRSSIAAPLPRRRRERTGLSVHNAPNTPQPDDKRWPSWRRKKKKTKTNENPINHKDVRTDAVTHETDDDIFFCLPISVAAITGYSSANCQPTSHFNSFSALAQHGQMNWKGSRKSSDCAMHHHHRVCVCVSSKKWIILHVKAMRILSIEEEQGPQSDGQLVNCLFFIYFFSLLTRRMMGREREREKTPRGLEINTWLCHQPRRSR